VFNVNPYTAILARLLNNFQSCLPAICRFLTLRLYAQATKKAAFFQAAHATSWFPASAAVSARLAAGTAAALDQPTSNGVHAAKQSFRQSESPLSMD